MPILAPEHRALQRPSQVVDVAAWMPDEDYPVFPVGSKPKELLICPDETPFPFLIPGHRYLFKRSLGWQVQQTWSEIIAYELSRPLKLLVPPCFLAVDSRGNEIGVLCEFFYGYPDDPAPPRLIHASDFLQRAEGTFDQKHGRPHSIRRNGALCTAANIPRPWNWWATALTFDALIGNTDRHPENWGFLLRRLTDATPKFSMAPIFDNGTSLGYEIPETKLGAKSERAALAAYVNRGRHHASWDKNTTQGDPHFALCQRLKEFEPTTSVDMENVILLTDSQISSVMAWCIEFEVSLPFSEQRAEFVTALVQSRRDTIRQFLGG